jgi:hypothetical protein
MPDGSYCITRELDTTDRVILGEAFHAAPPAIREAMAPLLQKLARSEAVNLHAAVDEVGDKPAPGKAHLFERSRNGALRFERVDLAEMSKFETVGTG